MSIEIINDKLTPTRGVTKVSMISSFRRFSGPTDRTEGEVFGLWPAIVTKSGYKKRPDSWAVLPGRGNVMASEPITNKNKNCAYKSQEKM